MINALIKYSSHCLIITNTAVKYSRSVKDVTLCFQSVILCGLSNHHMAELIRNTLESRRFFVVLNGKKSRWQQQRNGQPQGSVLAPMLFNIYHNEQSMHNEIQSLSLQMTCVLHTRRYLSGLVPGRLRFIPVCSKWRRQKVTRLLF